MELLPTLKLRVCPRAATSSASTSMELNRVNLSSYLTQVRHNQGSNTELKFLVFLHRTFALVNFILLQQLVTILESEWSVDVVRMAVIYLVI